MSRRRRKSEIKRAIPRHTQKNGVAYTDDQQQVFILYLRNVHHSITENDIHEYFSKYGDVKSVGIYNTKVSKKQVHKYSFVRFEKAETAGRVLVKTEHLIGGRTIQVRPADNWKQPDPDQEKRGGNVKDSTCSQENDPDKSPIFRLNYDCFLHVCSFLRLDQQINLSRTCLRFSGFLETHFHQKKSLNIFEKDRITLTHLRQILVKIGYCLIKFSCQSSLPVPARAFKLISQFCPNLRELRISDILKQKPAVYRDIIGSKLLYLTKIEMINCGIDDNVCQTLATLRNVEYIDFSENGRITGKHLDKFDKLIHLNLRLGWNIQLCHIGSICKRGTLKWLDVVGCPELSSGGLVEALLKLQKLEVLAFTYGKNQSGINKISELENLKTLIITCSQHLNVNFFKELAKNKVENLERFTLMDISLDEEMLRYIYKCKFLKKLRICDSTLPNSWVQGLTDLKQLTHLGLYHCHNVWNQALVKLFEQPTELTELDITGCTEFTDQYFFKIGDIIKSRGTKSSCTIYARDTGISRHILKEQKYMDYAPFVSLSFKDSRIFDFDG